MATDFKKSDVQILVDLINETNAGVALTTEVVTFGLPSVATGGSERNTDITVTAVEDSGYINSKNLNYNRVDLATIPGTRSVEFPKGDAVKISDMILEINAKYGINLTANDFVDGPLPDFVGGMPNEKLEFQVSAAANSLIYQGSVFLKLAAEDLDLAVIITNPVLNGLVYVQPVEPAP
jgi:hypothetical protein